MLFAFVLMLAVGWSLAAAVPASKNSPAKSTTKAVNTSTMNASAMKAKPTASKTAVKSKARETSKMTRALSSAEDLSGTITFVDATGKEVTLVGPNGVPYDFQLNKKTQVELSNNKIGMNELGSESNKQATVHFVPRTDGNLAENIKISAS
ncbi:MAG: hypothetical protein WBQ08_01400 [Candidatus Sulfotelmatobacter sp.]